MATIFIDPTVGGAGSGTFFDPFQSWASVTWVAGNTYLQKEGTTFVGTINVSTGGGGASTLVTLGSYTTGGQQVMNGTSRALIDANAGQFGIFVTGTQSFVVVDGFEVFNCNNANAIGIYKATGAGTDVTFQNNYVHDIIGTNAVGLKMFCDRAKYLNNIVRQVTADGIFFEGDDVEVAYNDVDEIDLGNSLGDCLQIADTTISSNDFWVHHNVFDHSDTAAKQTIVAQTTGSSGGIIERNICRGNNSSSHKTILILHPAVIVRNNQVTGGVWGIGLQGSSSTAFANLVVQTFVDGIGILVDAVSCSAFNNTVVYQGTANSTVPGISHFSASNTGCLIKNNISTGFLYGIRYNPVSATEQFNDAVGRVNNIVNASLAAVRPGTGTLIVAPTLNDIWYPINTQVLRGGTDVGGGLDLYGSEYTNPPPMGAVQNPYINNLLNLQLIANYGYDDEATQAPEPALSETATRRT